MENPKPTATANDAADAAGKKTWVDPQVDEITIADHTRGGTRPFSGLENVDYKFAS